MDVKSLPAFAAFAEEKLKKHNVFSTSRFFLDVYCLKSGQAQKSHVHAESDKVYVVLEGTCQFEVNGETAEHATGAMVLAPAGSTHGVTNPGPQPARLLVFMTPPPPHA